MNESILNEVGLAIGVISPVLLVICFFTQKKKKRNGLSFLTAIIYGIIMMIAGFLMGRF